MLPKLSVAGDLSYSSRQTVPQARSCDREASVAECGSRRWNSMPLISKGCPPENWRKKTQVHLKNGC